MNYPLISNEMLRLKAIQELEMAKRIPDSAVDRTTAFAREHFQVPYCFVTPSEDGQKPLATLSVGREQLLFPTEVIPKS